MAETRVSKLKLANELCWSLTQVLSQLESGARGMDSDNSAAALVDARQLEEQLDGQLIVIARLRNEKVAPISRLPDDILSYIFRAAPIFSDTVAAVNHRWRNVALSTPSLWTTICLGAVPCAAKNVRFSDITRPTRSEWRLARNSAYLRRSKGVGLTVDIGPDVAGADVRQVLQEIRPAVCEGPTTLQNLHFHTSSAEINQAVVSMVSTCRLMLRVLQIEEERAFESVPSLSTSMDALFAIEMPNLHTITLNGVPLPQSPSALPACRRLNMYIDSSVAHAHLVSFLRSCPDVEDLTVRRDFSEVDERQDALQRQGGKVLLAKLVHMDVWDDYESGHLYSVIKAPSLKRLVVGEVEEGVNQPLIEFLAHSSPRLKDVEFPVWNAECLQAALEHMPDLESLRLLNTYEGHLAALINEMSGTPERPSPCPRLNHLAVEMANDSLSVEVIEALGVFLKLRRSHVAVSEISTLELNGFPSEAMSLAADVDKFLWDGELQK